MSRKRGFEVVTDYQEKEIKIPFRATYHAAGYDFEAAQDCLVPCIWKALLKNKKQVDDRNDFSLGEENQKYLKSTLVPTGIKAYMGEDEFLQLANRSSNPIKNQLLLPNGIGVIDSDYYNNETNEGHIYFQFINYGIKDRLIKKGDRIGQGIFLLFLKADNESRTQKSRLGGFGSSGK
jgi:dUTP pyrophosphatase